MIRVRAVGNRRPAMRIVACRAWLATCPKLEKLEHRGACAVYEHWPHSLFWGSEVEELGAPRLVKDHNNQVLLNYIEIVKGLGAKNVLTETF